MKILIDKHLAKKILAIITCAISNCLGYIDPSKRIMCNKNNSYKIWFFLLLNIIYPFSLLKMYSWNILQCDYALVLCSLPKKLLSRIITKPSWKDKTITCLTNFNKSCVFSTINLDFWISKGAHDVFVLHYEKMKWFAINLAIKFFHYNDYL